MKLPKDKHPELPKQGTGHRFVDGKDATKAVRRRMKSLGIQVDNFRPQ